MKKQVLIYIGIVVLLIGLIGGGFYIYQSTNQKAEPAPVVATKTCPTSDEGRTITYNGKEGVSALDLLNQTCDTLSSGTGASAFVTTIDGITAGAKEFWSFEVNGEMAAVGAGSLITKDGDTIVWKLTTF
ncbi:MAG: DUF4430 domain-containing protein [Candidatus Saccharibacteria bacterium]